ncbi:hypothetical protein [Bowmanella yangjiangensis]|uniref:DUF3806 domain-containing protein n=1 Tax=Bowmanella yangjiangensis TaxID=2811230 RepID=A0ABS3CUC6_9ALTE|nr:hypothetical protein [Bowmanella yangjiangensis]MBN7820714.1 hypothetical protein [Bowmanella yangjiangensis]
MQMTKDELASLMSDTAHNAVLTTREEFGIELDHSPQSVALVDVVILKWLEKYQESALENNIVFTVCNLYGAYVGEIFRKLVGGSWHYDQSNPEAPYIVLEYAGHTYAFAGICYQRLVNDSQISVKSYFDQAVSNNVQ